MSVFISYSRKDTAYAHKLQKVLQDKGFEAWIIGDGIDYGSQWPKVVQSQLDACDVFIVVMTPNAYESTWVQRELIYAESKKKQIIPLLLEGEPWLSLRNIHFVDVRGGKLPSENFYRLLSKLSPRSREMKEMARSPKPSYPRDSFFRRVLKRLAGDDTTDAPPPDDD